MIFSGYFHLDDLEAIVFYDVYECRSIYSWSFWLSFFIIQPVHIEFFFIDKNMIVCVCQRSPWAKNVTKNQRQYTETHRPVVFFRAFLDMTIATFIFKVLSFIIYRDKVEHFFNSRWKRLSMLIRVSFATTLSLFPIICSSNCIAFKFSYVQIIVSQNKRRLLIWFSFKLFLKYNHQRFSFFFFIF